MAEDVRWTKLNVLTKAEQGLHGRAGMSPGVAARLKREGQASRPRNAISQRSGSAVLINMTTFFDFFFPSLHSHFHYYKALGRIPQYY